MTTDLLALYQSVIVDHDRHPRNFRVLEGGPKAEGFNPLCGDRLIVYVHVENDIIRDVAFQGHGCAIATASASLMTEGVKGRTLAEFHDVFDRLRRMLTESPDAPIENLGALSALAGVRRFPVRVKCALLAWHALRAATAAGEQVVTTE